MITKQSKLLFLFFSKDNPLWKTLLAHSPTQTEIATATDIKHSTLSNWRKGGEIDRRTIETAFHFLEGTISNTDLDDRKKKDLLRTVRDFSTQYASPTLKVYDIATRILGMTIDECQKIIDEVIYDKFTIFPAACYESPQDANEQFARFGGNYNLWARRTVHGKERWLKARLRVRYILKLKNRFIIRCKLNAPVLAQEYAPVLSQGSPNISHFEYDGCVRTRNNKLYWTFEKREEAGSDFFYFITDQGKSLDERLILKGNYLTTGQDTARSIVSDNILLQRLTLTDVENELRGTDFWNAKLEQCAAAEKSRAWMNSTANQPNSGSGEHKHIDKLWRLLAETAS
jgi:transcriptional regulator with XRE-family HTH domain